MHKKNTIYFLLIIIILIILYMLFNNQRKSININNSFSVEDTSAINKIFIADRSGNSVLLERNENEWIINNKYKARKDAINVLLNTISKIKIQRPVPINSLENVIRKMATTGVKIEIYTNNKKPLKTYTVGHSTSNHLGTYMLLDKGKKPYIMHIPGFNGFLSPRYGIIGNRIDENKWRNTKIFDINNKIKNISIDHINSPDSSFYLSIDKKILFDNNQNKIPYNNQKVKQFINNFQKLNCEAFKKDKSVLFKSNPIHIIVVNTDTLRTYEINNSITKPKEDNFNIQRMYATLNNGELMLIQNYVFNKVLITIDELKE